MIGDGRRKAGGNNPEGYNQYKHPGSRSHRSSRSRSRAHTGHSRRGLASASPATRERVARLGGLAHRGMHYHEEGTRSRSRSHRGGAGHSRRGLASASPATRERVSHLGGVAHRGMHYRPSADGRRKPGGNNPYGRAGLRGVSKTRKTTKPTSKTTRKTTTKKTTTRKRTGSKRGSSGRSR